MITENTNFNNDYEKILIFYYQLSFKKFSFYPSSNVYTN